MLFLSITSLLTKNLNTIRWTNSIMGFLLFLQMSVSTTTTDDNWGEYNIPSNPFDALLSQMSNLHIPTDNQQHSYPQHKSQFRVTALETCTTTKTYTRSDSYTKQELMDDIAFTLPTDYVFSIELRLSAEMFKDTDEVFQLSQSLCDRYSLKPIAYGFQDSYITVLLDL